MWNYDFQQPYACFNLANPTTGTWSMVAAGGQQVPQLAYTGGDACYNVQPASTYTLAVCVFGCPYCSVSSVSVILLCVTRVFVV